MARLLGDLPSDQPAPTGLCQIKAGQVDAESQYTNVVTPRILSDGVGNNMFITLTPPHTGWWEITAQAIWRQVNDPGTYQQFQWGVNLSPTDIDGWNEDRNILSIHAAQSWHESVVHTAFHVQGGVAYTASMNWYQVSAGFVQSVYTGSAYHHLMGEFS